MSMFSKLTRRSLLSWVAVLAVNRALADGLSGSVTPQLGGGVGGGFDGGPPGGVTPIGVNYIAEGDSITLGLGGQPAYPFAAISQMPGGAAATGATNTPTQSSVTGIPDTVFITDIGTSGISALTIDQNYTTRAGANFASAKRLNVLSYMAGTNTSGVNDTNFGQKYCLIRDYLRKARNTGYQRVVVGTITARDDDGGVFWASTLVPLNAQIRALYNSDMQADGLADFGASANFSPAVAADNLTLYLSDKLHPNPAGEVAMGTILEPVLFAAFQGAGAQVLAPATWSTFSTDASGNGGTDGTTTLANSNRTIGVPSGFASYGSRGFPGARTGKFYFEGVATVANQIAFGIVNDYFIFNNSTFIGFDAGNNSIAYHSSGVIKLANVVVASPAAFITGDIICCAVDIPNRLIWFCRGRTGVQASWNGNGSANPATGIGGISFAAVALHGAGDRYYPAGSIFTGTDSIISQFAAAQLSFAAPTGFSTFA